MYFMYIWYDIVPDEHETMIQRAKTISTAEARQKLADLINRAAYGKERQILTRRGKEVAALVPVEDLELLEEIEDLMDLREARAALAEAKEEGTVPWAEVKTSAGV